MGLKNKSASELLFIMLGGYGTFPVSGTEKISQKSFGFEADEDSVIASILDENGLERISDIGRSGKTIKAGKEIYFGFEAYSITLASGSGEGYRTESPF